MTDLTPLPDVDTLTRQLAHIERANLIRLAGAEPELEYIFRHALVQESAYQSLVRADRRRVHRAAGLALEALSNGAPTLGLALQLARHFEEAADDPRAIHYYALAGDAALKLFANAEAVAAYSRALAAAQRSSTTRETWEHLFSRRGRALELNSQYDTALANYQAMAQRAAALGDRRLGLAAAVAIGQLYATTTPLYDPAQAESMADSALAEARALGDEAAEAKILWNQLNLFRFTQRNPRARVVGEESLAIAQRLGLQEQAALDLNDLIHVYVDLGLWPEGQQAAAQVGRLWRELGNTAMLADSLATVSLYTSLRGDFAAALSQAEEAYRLSLSIGNLWGQSYSLSGMTWPHWYTGHPDQAIETSEACIRLGQQAGYLFAEVFDQARLGLMLGELGATERGFELLRQAKAAARYVGMAGLGTILSARLHLQLQSGQIHQAAETLEQLETSMPAPPIWEVDAVLRARSELALARRDTAGALHQTHAQLARLHELGLQVFLPEACILRAQALALAGRSSEALECLREALVQVQTMQAPAIEWMVLYALGHLAARLELPAEAAAAWTRARAIAGDFASHVPTPELRASFLARPDLRELFEYQTPPAAGSNSLSPKAPSPL